MPSAAVQRGAASKLGKHTVKLFHEELSDGGPPCRNRGLFPARSVHRCLFSNWQAGVPPSGQREVAHFEKRRYFIWSAAGQKPGEWSVHPFLPIYRGPGRVTRRRKWQPKPVFLAGKSYGQRSLAGYSPWDLRESGTTEQLTLLLVLVISSILIQTSMIIYKWHLLTEFSSCMIAQIG